MLDAERPRALDEPVHRGAVEVSGAPEAIRAGEPREQLQIHLLRETAKCAIADTCRLPERARLQVMSDKSDHLRTDVEAVDRVNVQAIEQ